jgi:hypothetical protein
MPEFVVQPSQLQGEALPQAHLFAEKREHVIKLAAVCVRLLGVSAGDALVELRQFNIRDDSVLREARFGSKQVAQQPVASPNAFRKRMPEESTVTALAIAGGFTAHFCQAGIEHFQVVFQACRCLGHRLDDRA